LAFALERIPDYLSEASSADRGLLQGILLAATINYQRFTTFGYRSPRAHYTRIVSFDPNREPDELFANFCEKRLLYARLINKVVDASPAMIVIDARFGLHTCPIDDLGTANLKKAVANGVSSGIPIVIGLDSISKDEFQKRHPELKPTFSENQLLGTPTLNFETQNPNLMFGLVRLNSDVRKIPFYWPTFFNPPSANSQAEPSQLPSLSLVAAQFYDNLLTQQPRIRKLLSEDEHPYSSFITERGFPTYDVLDIVCGAGDDRQTRDWKSCMSSGYGMAALRSHIVIVGERIDSEMRESVVGTVPGYILQANYIESLLDDRYFLPLSGPLQVLLSFFLFGLIEMFFRRLQPPERALAASVGALILVWVFSWLVLAIFGLFLGIWLPGMIALIGRYVDSKFKSKEGKPCLVESPQ
jgi:hypothetical protein